MQTSPKGMGFLERHEGAPLKAYLDPVGIWTIYVGLTAASGVIKPRAGMRITEKEGRRLLAKALRQNYEPAVAAQMPRADQDEFDAAVSFHFNTGAIARASWVKAWRDRHWGEVKRRIMLWKKGGGRVLPGLVRRREEEYRLMRYGEYGATTAASRSPGEARIVVPLSEVEIGEVRKAMAALGYGPGGMATGIDALALRAFQRDHDLTVDGILGRASLSTLQRRIDAKRKSAQAAGGAAAGGAGAAGTEAFTDMTTIPVWALWALFAVGLLWAAWLGYSYRDVVAAKLQNIAPRIARFLRSF